jgi:hypothetical protein
MHLCNQSKFRDIELCICMRTNWTIEVTYKLVWFPNLNNKWMHGHLSLLLFNFANRTGYILLVILPFYTENIEGIP